MHNLVALTGYSGVGKDESAKPLIDRGYVRHCFGDIIKSQVDPLIREYFGFSAHTDDRTQKAKIRRTLESWGEDNYDDIFYEYFAELPEKAVNTRLCRVKEARAWKERGGIIIEIHNPRVPPSTQWEIGIMRELRDSGLIDKNINNNDTIQVLHELVLEAVLG